MSTLAAIVSKPLTGLIGLFVCALVGENIGDDLVPILILRDKAEKCVAQKRLWDRLLSFLKRPSRKHDAIVGCATDIILIITPVAGIDEIAASSAS